MTDEIASLRWKYVSVPIMRTRARQQELKSKTRGQPLFSCGSSLDHPLLTERCWRELCEKLDADPWGLTYGVVARKLGGQTPGLAARGRKEAIAYALFPTFRGIRLGEVLNLSTAPRPICTLPTKSWERRPPSSRVAGCQSRRCAERSVVRCPASLRSSPQGDQRLLLVRKARPAA